VSTADALRGFGSATLGECGALRMHARIRPVWAGAVVAGPAITAKLGHADNLAIHVAVATNELDGVVLVADATDPPEYGYWGEVLTTGAEARGIAGLVIDGGCRDVAALEAHGFPVFSALVALTGAAKVRGGTVGQTITAGGASVSPGDWIVGDADGVVVIPSANLDAVIAASQERTVKEAWMFEELRAGKTTVELLDLDPSGLDE